jgi:hypothetical protein
LPPLLKRIDPRFADVTVEVFDKNYIDASAGTPLRVPAVRVDAVNVPIERLLWATIEVEDYDFGWDARRWVGSARGSVPLDLVRVHRGRMAKLGLNSAVRSWASATVRRVRRLVAPRLDRCLDLP